MKCTKERSGRLFLNSNKKELNSVSWNVFIKSFNFEKKDKCRVTYHAELTIKKGNTTVLLHTNNDGEDIGFVSFLNKLNMVSEHTRDFVTCCGVRNPSEEEVSVERYWLNDENGIDKVFTGSLVKIYDKYSYTLEISSCERSARWYINRYSRNADKSQIGELVQLQRAIDRLIQDIHATLKEAKTE